MVVSAGMAVNPTSFPQWAVKYVASKDTIPFVYRDLEIDIILHGFTTLVDNEECRKGMKKYAKDYPEKPIMQAEFGKTKHKRQARWIKSAYETIKSWPGMKAAIYWDSVNYGLGDDYTLSGESSEVYKEIMKDPYFSCSASSQESREWAFGKDHIRSARRCRAFPSCPLPGNRSSALPN